MSDIMFGLLGFALLLAVINDSLPALVCHEVRPTVRISDTYTVCRVTKNPPEEWRAE